MQLTHDVAIPLVVLLPLFGAIVCGLFGRFLSKQAVATVAVGVVAFAFLFAVHLFLSLVEMKAAGEVDPALRAVLFDWVRVGELHVEAAFRFDSLSAVMTLVITGVGALIHLYSTGYMADDEGFKRYFAYLNLFTFAMLTLVLGDNLALLFVGWEGVGLCSYLLIGFWFDDTAKAIAGQKAFVTNRIGDFGFLLAMLILLVVTSGKLDYESLRTTFTADSVNSRLFLPAVTLLLFVGATGKSAQIPLYVWLPDAMAGPTPVSALIHAATMVTAGVYMVCRLHFLYVQTPMTLAIIAAIGALTAFFAATIALTQRDIKKVLAYSTVSQLGYMFLGVGVGAFSAAIFHLVTHAFFKACLFLGAGAVIHALHGEQDGFKMGGLRKKLPTTHWTFLVATLAIAGVAPLAGFWSKDEILFRAVSLHHAGGVAWIQQIAFGLGMVTALLTAFYMGRLYFLVFSGKYRGDPHHLDHLHLPSGGMGAALILLGVLSVVGGLMGMPWPSVNLFGNWLAPIFASSADAFSDRFGHAVEYALMAISFAMAIGGLLLARKWYGDGPSAAPTALAESWRRAHGLLSRAYAVDDLIELVIKRPFAAASAFSHKVIDAILIDGLLVNGTARFLGAVGSGLRRFQSGDVQHYALGIAAGTLLLLYLLVA